MFSRTVSVLLYADLRMKTFETNYTNIIQICNNNNNVTVTEGKKKK